jgi:hypothetical protein
VIACANLHESGREGSFLRAQPQIREGNDEMSLNLEMLNSLAVRLRDLKKLVDEQGA